MEINFFIFFTNSKIVQARLVLSGYLASGILSSGFPQLLCCLCLTARTRCTSVRLRAAAGVERFEEIFVEECKKSRMDYVNPSCFELV